MQISGVYNPLVDEDAAPKPSDKQLSQIKRMGKAMAPGAATSVSLTKSTIKIETRENGKGMKITFKLNKEESEGFLNICNMQRPEGISQEQFVKFLVFKGMDTFQSELKERVQKFKQDHPEEYAKMEADAKASDESLNDNDPVEGPKADIIKD